MNRTHDDQVSEDVNVQAELTLANAPQDQPYIPELGLWFVLANLESKNKTPYGVPGWNIWDTNVIIVAFHVEAATYDGATIAAHNLITQHYTPEERYSVTYPIIQYCKYPVRHELLNRGERSLYPLTTTSGKNAKLFAERTLITPLTVKEAQARVGKGSILHPIGMYDADGVTPQSYRVTSVRTWKTRKDHIEIKVKRGQYDYATITHHELNAQYWYMDAQVQD